jgi:hypothetical protein
VIDQIREQIQQRLDQLDNEVDRLRKALAALDPRSSATPAPKAPARKRTVARAPKPEASPTTSVPTKRPSRTAARAPRRSASGTTKSSVLAALAGGALIGKTQDAIRSLHFRRDRDWLQS